MDNHLQLGRVGELLIKAKFIKNGLDVFSTEVDDKGIDFVVKNKHGEYFDVQVKASNQTYVFMRKEVFKPRTNLYVALLVIDKKDNNFFVLIPSLDFEKKPLPNYLSDKEYEGLRSKPEYGISPTDRNLNDIVEKYSFSKIIHQIINADNSVVRNSSGA